MAKRKKAKSKSKRTFFKRSSSKRKGRGKSSSRRLILFGILKVVGIVSVLAAVGVSFAFLQIYVRRVISVSKDIATVKLAKPPAWVTNELTQKIYEAATANEDLKIDDDLIETVQQNVQGQVAWLEEVGVRQFHDSVHITGRWRKPVALIESATAKYYVDPNLVVLDYVEIPTLPIVRVRGLASVSSIPKPGEAWRVDDLEAAVALVKRLARMDELVAADRPLLNEIASIDVSNYGGRRDSREPHIIMYAKDNTRIIWGAELGAWSQHLEATDEEKLAGLYRHYEEYGTLLNEVQYINLRDPRDRIPQPIDRY